MDSKDNRDLNKYTNKEKDKVKFVVLPVDLFEKMLARLEDDSDLRAIREAKNEPLYDQREAEDYIFMNPVKRERTDRGWTQKDLAGRIGVKQSTIAKWEKEGAVYRKDTRHKLAKVFRVNEDVFR
jgi:ribosome-binding protein aMBF1 (putative translation factor)